MLSFFGHVDHFDFMLTFTLLILNLFLLLQLQTQNLLTMIELVNWCKFAVI